MNKNIKHAKKYFKLSKHSLNSLKSTCFQCLFNIPVVFNILILLEFMYINVSIQTNNSLNFSHFSHFIHVFLFLIYLMFSRLINVFRKGGDKLGILVQNLLKYNETNKLKLKRILLIFALKNKKTTVYIG